VLVFWTAVNAWSGQWLAMLVGLVTVAALAPGYRRDS
jgi:putative membrane protein